MAAPPPVSIPTNPEDGVDESHDLNPGSPVDKKRLDSLISERPNASELQEKGILKGAPNDALAGKKAELEKSILEDRLDKELAARPPASELVKKGILDADEVPS